MVFITSRAQADDELTGLVSRAAAYVTKPFRPRYLIETVDRLSPANTLAAQRRDPQA